MSSKTTKVLTEDTVAFSHKLKVMWTVPKGPEITGVVWTGIDYRWRTKDDVYSTPSKPKYTMTERS